ncbi:hypothetical protein JCM16163A_35190 [Paenibacillus sp. YK5]|uniref:hypothetical protein n=1 Tax=Paenibacillus sp. Pae108 TaxID=2926019 RepID=UPI002118982C|nr:hypothetical protein [Paenibacillus sp. Pae108]
MGAAAQAGCGLKVVNIQDLGSILHQKQKSFVDSLHQSGYEVHDERVNESCQSRLMFVDRAYKWPRPNEF